MCHRPKRLRCGNPLRRSVRHGFATALQLRILIWDRDRGWCRSEAELLDELDGLGSGWYAELVVDRRDVGLDGRALEVEPIGDLLEREMCRKEAEDPQLGCREPVVLSSPDPLFETP